MTSKQGFKFGNYELRVATHDDDAMARAWTLADETHAGKIAPEFWTEQDKGIDSFVLCDKDGPVLFLRMQLALRFFIQFAPDLTDKDKDRTRRGLTAGFNWLAARASYLGIREIIFDSAERMLRIFTCGVLGFQARKNTLSFHTPDIAGMANVRIRAGKPMESPATRQHGGSELSTSVVTGGK